MERSSPLMALPPELRNRIYRYAIVQNEPIDVTETTKKKEPALLATCKRIRNEALRMFYSENSFFCHMNFGCALDEVKNSEPGGESEILKRLEGYFCWLATLGVATTSVITDFRVQVEIGWAVSVIPPDSGITPEHVCAAIRREVAPDNGAGFMVGWKAPLLDLGMEPRVVRFVVPDSIKTFDDAMNKVVVEEWKKRLEEWELEHVNNLCKS